MKANIWKLFFASIIIFSVFTWIGCKEDSEKIHIAVAGPESINKSVNLYFDEVNEKGGIDGKKIIVDYFDDQNKPELARKKATEIAGQNQAVAVIGHSYSTCSISAGSVYKKHGIPAITPTSSVTEVTTGNEWYFRTAITDTSQGQFLADYAKTILKQNTASIIYDEDGFAYLADIFQKRSDTIGLEIKHKRGFDKETENPDQLFKKIVRELSSESEKDRGIIFIATYSEEGHHLIKAVRDMGIRNPIIGPAVFCWEGFFEKFSKYHEEIRKPGYYTGDIHVSSFLLFDTAGMKAQEFRNKYKEMYEKYPDWGRAFAYDTAMLLHQAIKESGITGEAHSLKADREKIREYLAELNSGNATEGLNGLNYFDKNGDSVGKQLSVGIYRNGNIISAPGQLRPVQRFSLIPNIGEEIKKERIVVIGDHNMYKISVVYIGVNIQKISAIDVMKSSCMLDFYIWFRYQDEFDLGGIEFINALEPIRLEMPDWEEAEYPETDSEAGAEKQAGDGDDAKKSKDRGTAELVRKERMGNITSVLYHISASFKNDFRSDDSGYHVGFRLCHRHLTWNNMICVTDFLGMKFKDAGSFSEKMKKADVIGPGEEWITDHALFFQDIIEKSTMGSLKYLDIPIKSLEHSQINFRVSLKRPPSGLRRRIPADVATYLALCCFAALIFFSMFGNKLFKHSPRLIWFFNLMFAFLLLLSAESALINGIMRSSAKYQTITIITFDIFYWLISALFLHLALQPFIWTPLEQRSGRPIPGVMRQLPAYLIYFTACYGIVAFVFELDINKLMATSGVLAMGVGLLIKDNIINYFASISIFQGREIRIGHWVRIGDFEEGKVQEITRMVTRIVTRDGSVLSIPNNVVLSSSIDNYSQPTDIHQLTFQLETVPEYSPARVLDLLEQAVLSAECVLKDPGPIIVFEGQGDSSAKYSVKFSVRDYGKKPRHFTAAWKAVWTHLEEAGIELATPHRILHLLDETPGKDSQQKTEI